MEPGYIDGIYNYCDRWCERCGFCSRCRNFEVISKITAEESDIENDEFWLKIKASFEQTSQMLVEMARDNGLDLGNLPPEIIEECTKQEELKDQKLLRHQLTLVTIEYIGKAMSLMQTEEIYKIKGAEIKSGWQMGLLSYEEAKTEIHAIRECKEVICWYLYFIQAKCLRALSGKMDEEYWEEDEGYPKDHDGSAKIAMIAMDRSIDAWTNLSSYLPHVEDQILSLLALLQKTRRITEEEFPDAWKFIRPGFDEEV